MTDTQTSPTDISEEMVEETCAEAWGREWATMDERAKAQERREAKCWAKLFVPRLRAQDAARIADLEEVLADKYRLARELDVAMRGEEGAAKQPSLCDLIEPARMMRTRIDSLERESRVLREALVLAEERLTAMITARKAGGTYPEKTIVVRETVRAALTSGKSAPTRTPTDRAEGIQSGVPVDYYPSTGESAPVQMETTRTGESK